LGHAELQNILEEFKRPRSVPARGGGPDHESENTSANRRDTNRRRGQPGDKPAVPGGIALMLTHRLATAEDAPVLAEMNHQLIHDEGHRNPMTVTELEQRMRCWLAGDYTAVLFEQSGHVVAYALFREEDASVYVRQFFVHRDRRRRGTGREAMRLLLEQVLHQAPRVTLDVLVNNRVAWKFWQAIGFHDYAVTMEFRPPTQPPQAIHE
jgi:ribosomal protein S18 acetylase RimI-like enzyme